MIRGNSYRMDPDFPHFPNELSGERSPALQNKKQKVPKMLMKFPPSFSFVFPELQKLKRWLYFFRKMMLKG